MRIAQYSAVAPDPGGDPSVPRIPPFSLAIVALLYSYQLAIYQFL